MPTNESSYNVIMKKIITIIILGLYCTIPSQADDIRDFQIEGMSVDQSLLDKFNKKFILHIKEVTQPETDPKLIADWICFQLEKRTPFRRAMKMAIQRCMKNNIAGIKIQCSGRLGGIEIARSESYKEGKIPNQTYRANINYSFSEALTTYGKIGVKVWVYYGDKFRPRVSKLDAKVIGG